MFDRGFCSMDKLNCCETLNVNTRKFRDIDSEDFRCNVPVVKRVQRVTCKKFKNETHHTSCGAKPYDEAEYVFTDN